MYSQHVADAIHMETKKDRRLQEERDNAPILAILRNPAEDAYHERYYKWQHNYKLRYHPDYGNGYEFGVLYHRQPKDNARWCNPTDLVDWFFRKKISSLNRGEQYGEPQKVDLYVDNDAKVVYMQTGGARKEALGNIKPVINSFGEEDKYSSFNWFRRDISWVEKREQAKLAAKVKAREEGKEAERSNASSSAAAQHSVVNAMPNVQISRPLRTNYEVTQTGFIGDMKKGFKKAVDDGKKMYKQGKEMYKQYKKSKEEKTEK